MTTPFNPLDKQNLGASIGEALMATPRIPLKELKSFKGAGVYCLYYGGDFKAYQAISAQRKNHGVDIPIYVGKAIPAGGRKGSSLDATSITSTTALYKRLVEHRDTVLAVENLYLEDFSCRVLVVDDIWIPLGEALLINRFKPLWNSVVDGFGNHDPGKGRYNGQRPRWDVLHPGRAWATKCTPRSESRAAIIRDVEEYFRAHPVSVTSKFFVAEDRSVYLVDPTANER